MEQRTTKQNAAIHVLFRMIAEELNGSGFERKVTIGTVDVPWNEWMIKEWIWKPVQKAKFGKKSTTQLTTQEVDQVFDAINHALAEKGIHIPFPSIKEVIQ